MTRRTTIVPLAAAVALLAPAPAQATERMTARRAAVYTRDVLEGHFPEYMGGEDLGGEDFGARYHRACRRASRVRFTCRWNVSFGDTYLHGYLKLWHRGTMWHYRGAYRIVNSYCLSRGRPRSSCIERGLLL